MWFFIACLVIAWTFFTLPAFRKASMVLFCALLFFMLPHEVRLFYALAIGFLLFYFLIGSIRNFKNNKQPLS
jgi:hypothetical protein